MILNKYYILIIIFFLFIGCEDDIYDDETCLNGIEQTIEATSFTKWKYFEVSDSGFVELDWMPDSIAQNSYNWDIAMMRNHFRTNSGLSGFGNAGVFMIDETWTCESFNAFGEVPDNAIFTEDGMLTNIYQPWEHDNPNEAYTEGEGNTVLENWGWFDIDDSYYFYYTHKQFIVKLPNDKGYIKIWPYQYYGELGQSAHTTLVYDFIQELD